MTKVEELENVILGQIEALGDLSVMENKDEAKELIERSKVMADLTGSYIDIQKTKLEAQRVKIDSIRCMHETAIGIGKADEGVKKYLGIEGFWITDKPLNPKLDAIRKKYKNGIPQECIDGLAEKLTDIYLEGKIWQIIL